MTEANIKTGDFDGDDQLNDIAKTNGLKLNQMAEWLRKQEKDLYTSKLDSQTVETEQS